MSDEVTIPLLPCASLDDVIAFYEVLGFDTTYRQRKPNPYASLRREDLHLHFFEMAGFDPAASYGTCLVLTRDTGELHRAFAAGMRAAYGKVLIAGTPRMTRPRPRKNADGVSGFSIVDPGGNWIRIVQHDVSALPAATGTQPAPQPAGAEPAGQSVGTEPAPRLGAAEPAGRLGAAEPAGRLGAAEPAGRLGAAEPAGRLAKALANAVVLADSKGDARQAARILDSALARADADEDPVVRLEVMVYRAEVALVLDDPDTAGAMLARVDRVTLSPEAAERAAAAYEAAADLAAALR